MKLVTEPYLNQVSRWPKNGRQILAQFDDHSIIVYQAYRPTIGHFAIENGYFGGEFSLDRMSWIKPNFLWMMYRSGWGTKPGQEVILAVRIKRSAFDQILANVVHSTYIPDSDASPEEWKKAVKRSSVRLQWDPDRHPSSGKLERRAIQLGLRDEFLRRYAREWIIDIEDISAFVQQQHQYKGGDWTNLVTPSESVYPVFNADIAEKLGLSANN